MRSVVSAHRNGLSRIYSVGPSLLILFLSALPTSAQVRARHEFARSFGGAIFTTDSSCTVVDQNIYESKTDVYLTGGGKGVRLPDGSYYVQVTEPSGKVVLGTSGASLPILVVKGKFAACYQLWALTGGFDDSRNGEYKVWVCQDPAFSHPSCKTDNFRVAPRARTATHTATPLPPSATRTRTPTLNPTGSVTPTFTPTGPITPTLTPTGSVTPTFTLTGSVTPTFTATGTPTSAGTPTQTATPLTPGGGSNTETPTPTVTRSSTAIATPTRTATPIPDVATTTPTFGVGPGEVPSNIPTLSPAMLVLLAAALAGLGLYFTRRI